MDEVLFQMHSKALLVKINAITGWSLPPDSETVNIILDQFQKLMVEEYGELNTDEIEHAFRSRCHTVEDWGKNMNLGLINKILKPYLKERYYISDMEEKLNKTDDGYTAEASKNWYREQIEKGYQGYLASDSVNVYWYWYEILSGDGIIEGRYYKTHLKLIQESVDDAGDVENSKKAKLISVMDVFALAKRNKLKNIYKPA